MAGAVDLAALAQQQQARAQAEQARAARAAAGPGAAVAVVDVTEATFQSEVLDRSATVPVVIDFWADWCGPCKQLSPILERLAAADAGTWVLAKIDVDANQQIAAAAQVQSIPTVLVVWQGQVIPGFQGALPEPQVRDFLDQVIALAAGSPPGAEAEAGVDPGTGLGPESAGGPIDPGLAAAEEALMRDDLDGAEAAYRAVLADRPGDAEATAGLARVGLLRRTQGADPAAARAASAATPGDVEARLLAADLDLLDGDAAGAFSRLIDGVRAADGPDRDRLRTRLVELFDAVGPEHPDVVRARGQLASALF